jgi:4-alpha-glucanotransferase
VNIGRASGILLHPTSLPGQRGIGTLGVEARRFVDFLAAAGQHVWQVLPLSPTGYGDSPYQALSAFAGNPLLVDFDQLVEDGLLARADLGTAPAFPGDRVDFERVIPFVRGALARAFDRLGSAPAAERAAFETFCHGHRAWLDDFALFAALKDAHGGVAWVAWDPAVARREPGALRGWTARLAREIEAAKFVQFLFFRQWAALRDYAHGRGVRLMGDVPIFVAHDSADVWARPDLFDLQPDGHPGVVAGVPPDYFSATGQLWGNPLYRWNVMADAGYRWWIERFRAVFSLVDLARLDHFRGFEACWEVPWPAETAMQGRWVKGPGAALFEAVRDALGELPIVAENLGVITPEVEALRTRFGFPGMAILQFAFGTDPQAPTFRPHAYTRDRVVYTGTHDNDTTIGWWTGAGAGDSTRTADDIVREHDFARRYLGTDGSAMHWVLIRAVLASVADLVMVPAQDLLGLGSEARMNVPGKATGNWRWRCGFGLLDDRLAARLRELTVLYERAAA